MSLLNVIIFQTNFVMVPIVSAKMSERLLIKQHATLTSFIVSRFTAEPGQRKER